MNASNQAIDKQIGRGLNNNNPIQYLLLNQHN